MIKKVLTLVLTMALLVVSGPLEVFAAGEENVADITVTVKNITAETADIEWETIPGAASYAVLLNGVVIEPELTQSFEYTLTDLTENTDYTVTVRAVSDGQLLGEGEANFTGGVQEDQEVPGDTEELAVGIIDVTAANVTASAADISWSEVEGAYYYELVLNEDVADTALSATSYSLTGLKGSTNYTATVLARDVDDTVLAEGSTEFTTDKATTPAKVKNFRTVSSYQAIVLKWKKSKNVDGYKIRWTGSNGTKGTINKKATATKHVFKIAEKNRKVKYTFKITAVRDGVQSKKVTKSDKAVQLMEMQVTLKVNKNLKNHDRPEGRYSINLKAGTNIRTIGFTNGKYVFQKKVKGKLRTFHVMRIACRNQKIKYIGSYKKKSGWKIVQPIYTEEEAEDFINRLGVKSNTKNLIWVNQYSQRIFVFKSSSKGKKNDWKLMKVCKKDEDDGAAGWMVASGKPTSPTSTGLTSIKQRDIGGSGKVPFWNVTTWFSIHGNTSSAWGPLGWPKSGACCRNTTPHAKWIYYNTPMRTSVYVY